jgi:hypothetical protein
VNNAAAGRVRAKTFRAPLDTADRHPLMDGLWETQTRTWAATFSLHIKIDFRLTIRYAIVILPANGEHFRSF